MKYFTKLIIKGFFLDKGWLHFLGMIDIIYLLLSWGNSEYAATTLLWPSSMVHSITNQTIVEQLTTYFLFAAVIGVLIECGEIYFFKAKFQFSDVFWTSIAVFFAYPIYSVTNNNIFMFLIMIMGFILLLTAIMLPLIQKITNKTS